MGERFCVHKQGSSKVPGTVGDGRNSGCPHGTGNTLSPSPFALPIPDLLFPPAGFSASLHQRPQKFLETLCLAFGPGTGLEVVGGKGLPARHLSVGFSELALTGSPGQLYHLVPLCATHMVVPSLLPAAVVWVTRLSAWGIGAVSLVP